MRKVTTYFLVGVIALLVSCETEFSAPEDSGNTPTPQSGLITAGEWNDLDNWSFWRGLIAGDGRLKQIMMVKQSYGLIYFSQINLLIWKIILYPLMDRPSMLI